MRGISSWLMVIVGVVLAVLGGMALTGRTSTLCRCRVGARSLSSEDRKTGRLSASVSPETSST